MKVGILLCVVLGVLILPVLSKVGKLHCYICNSNVDPECADDTIPKIFAAECNATVDPYCRKIIQIVDEVKSVVRTCGSKSSAKTCFKTAGKNNAQICSCNHDLCNNARSLNQQERIMTIISSVILLTITMAVVR